MSNRERWIVYPLLFFSIGLSLIDKMVKPALSKFKSVTCEQLTVASVEGIPQIRMWSDENDAGHLAVYQPVGIAEPNDSTLNSATEAWQSPQKIVEFGADVGGGFIKVFGPNVLHAVRLGHDAERHMSGLVATDEHGELIALRHNSSDAIWGQILPWSMLKEEATDADTYNNLNISGDSSEDESDRPTSSTDASPEGAQTQVEESPAAESESESESADTADSTEGHRDQHAGDSEPGVSDDEEGRSDRGSAAD